ncbi:hypothetical protein NPIL_404001 [Nephila pilipes]|uniref:Uncharacterized protein n=1 Tax=Nephila pilipes TaxID=299642 RepID=A0A8X6TKK5_NEPPI|nr:hypothetical protein NPIL_404001 [Nephila pilipes]
MLPSGSNRCKSPTLRLAFKPLNSLSSTTQLKNLTPNSSPEVSSCQLLSSTLTTLRLNQSNASTRLSTGRGWSTYRPITEDVRIWNVLLPPPLHPTDLDCETGRSAETGR